MELSRGGSFENRGLLYPLMVIAAIAVSVFTLMGMLTLMGWIPSAMASAPAHQPKPSAVTFDCAECGVIDSIRELERQAPEGLLKGPSLAVQGH